MELVVWRGNAEMKVRSYELLNSLPCIIYICIVKPGQLCQVRYFYISLNFIILEMSFVAVSFIQSLLLAIPYYRWDIRSNQNIHVVLGVWNGGLLRYV